MEARRIIAVFIVIDKTLEQFGHLWPTNGRGEIPRIAVFAKEPSKVTSPGI